MSSSASRRYSRVGALWTAIALVAAGCEVRPVTSTTGTGPVLHQPAARGAGVVQGGPKASRAAVQNDGAAGAAGKPGRTLLAVYMVGSDLEDDAAPRDNKPDEAQNGQLNKAGAGTADLNEMVTAYQALSDAEKANVELLVTFGGARQTGWKGTKTVDAAGLLKDAADGYFGNEPADTYLAFDESANMGDGKTFEAFLERVRERQGDGAKTLVDVWNHGGSYAGIGPDHNFDPDKGVLALSAIRGALEATKFQADMIGFDACLMASVEVMAHVHGHFDYMVASEEAEPGHGWDYTQVVGYMGQHPEATLTALGRYMVDSFLDSPAHAVTSGRTLSLINLEHADALITQLEAFAGASDVKLDAGYQHLLDAAGKATRFGSEGKGGDEFSVDLVGFLNAAQSGDAAAQADLAAAAAKSCVVYAREDGTKPGASGLTIFSLQNLGNFESQFYNRDNALSPAWYAFVERFMQRGGQDTNKPTVVEAEPATENGVEGERITVTDDVGVDDVNAVHALAQSEHSYVVAEEVPEEETAPNAYFQPAWDGGAVFISDEAGGKAIVPTKLEEVSDGYEIRKADGTWNGDDAVIYLVLDAQHRVVNTWVVPYEEDAHGRVQVSREQYELLDGDTLAFYQHLVDTDADQDTLELTKPITVRGTPDFSWADVGDQGFYFTEAKDLKGNLQNSTVHKAL